MNPFATVIVIEAVEHGTLALLAWQCERTRMKTKDKDVPSLYELAADAITTMNPTDMRLTRILRVLQGRIIQKEKLNARSQYTTQQSTADSSASRIPATQETEARLVSPQADVNTSPSARGRAAKGVDRPARSRKRPQRDRSRDLQNPA
jgi:hypothetical protein